VLHQVAAAATCDRRRSYIKPSPLLHKAAGVLHAAAAVASCYMPVPPLLCQVAGVLHGAAAVATCRSSRCCFPSAPLLRQVAAVLHGATAIATSRSRRCCFPSAAGDATSGRRYQGGVADGDARKCVCAARAGWGVRRWPWNIPSLVTFTFFFFVFLEALTTDGSASYGWGPGGSGILIPRGTLSRPLTFFTCTRTWSAHVPLQT
jgi:hypothetical protein